MRYILVASALLATGCGGAGPTARFELAPTVAAQYPTAYIAAVVADAEGDDLEPGSGEHVTLGNNWDRRADLGGWWVEDDDGDRLPLGTGRQLEAGGRLHVYTSCGEDTATAVFSCLGKEVLDDGGELLRLLDSSGSEVARFEYGDA